MCVFTRACVSLYKHSPQLVFFRDRAVCTTKTPWYVPSETSSLLSCVFCLRMIVRGVKVNGSRQDNEREHYEQGWDLSSNLLIGVVDP